MEILSNLLKSETLMHNQNPGNYAVRRGISSDRVEKHLQGIVMVHWEVEKKYSFPLLFLINVTPVLFNS